MTQHRTTRRTFLKQAGIGSLAAVGAGMLPAATLAAIDNTELMKITRIDGVSFRNGIHIGGGGDGAEFCWVRLHTDTGIVGTGETYPFHRSELGALKDYARRIIGRDPRDIDGIWRGFYHAMAMRNAGGGDIRILSAINMAQLDILGQASGLPLYRLLGGKTRPRVRVYNTATNYWAINETRMGTDTMKIYPFLANRGEGYISNRALDEGMSWIREIRDNVGDQMDICADCWGRFNLTSAMPIAKALELYNIMYLEDVMLMNNAKAYAQLARETSVPICMSETLATRYKYREFFDLAACDMVMYDLTWCGGVSEAKKISDMADTHFIPTSPYTCGGPLLYFCSAHLCTALANFLIMESNYWKFTHQYPYSVDNVPIPEDGHVTAPELPGIGAQIKPELLTGGHDIARRQGPVRAVGLARHPPAQARHEHGNSGDAGGHQHRPAAAVIGPYQWGGLDRLVPDSLGRLERPAPGQMALNAPRFERRQHARHVCTRAKTQDTLCCLLGSGCAV